MKRFTPPEGSKFFEIEGKVLERNTPEDVLEVIDELLAEHGLEIILYDKEDGDMFYHFDIQPR